MLKLIGLYAGALLITFILTRGANWLLHKITNQKTSALISFVLVCLFCLLLGSPNFGFRLTFFIYIPCLLLWLLIDLRKTSNQASK